jgi:hypothetical protein
MPELHRESHIPEACPSAYKVFFFDASGAHIRPQQQRSGNWSAVSETPSAFPD